MLNKYLQASKIRYLSWLILIILVILGGALFFGKGDGVIPSSIKKQLNFPVIYPNNPVNTKIEPSDFSYQKDNSTLSISTNYKGNAIFITEQKAPSNITADPQSANQTLGVHPYAQIQTRFGLVSLTRVFQTTSFKSQGQLGVLVSNGTLILIHSSQQLSNSDWVDLLNSMKVVR